MCCLLKRACCLLHIVAREANELLKVSVFPGETLMIFAIETQNTTHSDSGDFLALQGYVTLLNYLCDRLSNPHLCSCVLVLPLTRFWIILSEVATERMKATVTEQCEHRLNNCLATSEEHKLLQPSLLIWWRSWVFYLIRQ